MIIKATDNTVVKKHTYGIIVSLDEDKKFGKIRWERVNSGLKPTELEGSASGDRPGRSYHARGPSRPGDDRTVRTCTAHGAHEGRPRSETVRLVSTMDKAIQYSRERGRRARSRMHAGGPLAAPNACTRGPGPHSLRSRHAPWQIDA